MVEGSMLLHSRHMYCINYILNRKCIYFFLKMCDEMDVEIYLYLRDYSRLQNDRQVEKSQTGQARMPKPSEFAILVIALVTGGDPTVYES